eukprot:GHVQ01024409.1.p1 GENE.GHVQ01024409.1~~GHVQ01024409.1.p1  ORF type:complete len:120 (-),score=13.99 GHVQ01024409.1:99-458(-)
MLPTAMTKRRDRTYQELFGPTHNDAEDLSPYSSRSRSRAESSCVAKPYGCGIACDSTSFTPKADPLTPRSKKLFNLRQTDACEHKSCHSEVSVDDDAGAFRYPLSKMSENQSNSSGKTH